jgi:hypothetical protein
MYNTYVVCNILHKSLGTSRFDNNQIIQYNGIEIRLYNIL